MEIAVYSQMTKSPEQLFGAMKKEIGYKCTCVPFAVKMIEALKTLDIRTEQQALSAANVFMSNLQTLIHGGITPEDYDKIDAVKRGQTITLSARVDAFYRAAARKGYQITDTIIAVPKEDAGGVYFKENFADGSVIYTLEDSRKNTDRKITADRLINGYFDSFVCRLAIYDIRQRRNIMVVCDMSTHEIMMAQAASDNGIFRTKWVDKKHPDGKAVTRRDGSVIKEKVSTNEINQDSFWVKWTRDMVEKTIIRKALKRVREILPDLSSTIYAFTSDEHAVEEPKPEEIIPIPVETRNVDLDHLTPEQQADADEMKELFIANPKLARDTANEIMSAFFEKGEDRQALINQYFASIVNLQKGKSTAAIIRPLFGE
ncbi:MAG: hypothetical protein AAGU27_24870 [Dehalobacterium sp.]